MNILSTFGQGLINVGGNALDGFIQGSIADYFNKRQENRSRDWQEYMWNKQNAYNEAYYAPKAIMNRYTEAGLNPNLIYSHVGGNVGNAYIPSTSLGNSNIYSRGANNSLSTAYAHFLNLKNRQYEDAVKNQALIKMEKENDLLSQKILNEKEKRNYVADTDKLGMFETLASGNKVTARNVVNSVKYLAERGLNAYIGLKRLKNQERFYNSYGLGTGTSDWYNIDTGEVYRVKKNK